MSARAPGTTTLHRTDRYALGSGDGTIFAPPHPQWLDRPGFWDGVQWYGHILAPAYTIALVDNAGCDIPVRPSSRTWTPSALVSRWTAGPLAFEERRVLLPGGRVASDCTLVNDGADDEPITIVLWTAIEGSAVAERTHVRALPDAIHLRVLAPDVQWRGDEIALDLGLRLVPGAHGVRIIESQHARSTANLPDWHVAPFRDRLHEDGVIVHIADAPGGGRTLVYAALHHHVALAPGSTFSFSARLELTPADPELHARSARPWSAQSHAGEESERLWSEYFEHAPQLTASDAHVERFFAHRLAGLRLNALAPCGRYAHPTMAEGTHFFHAAISYSAWCHARELCWVDAARAHGALLTFLDRQREDGSLPGILYVNGEHPTASYFADWGGALSALEQVHPDRAFLARVYGPLARYAAWFDRDRDPDARGLYHVRDPYETGQEYMSRYTAVLADADAHHFDYRLALLGVDATVYAYRLRRALARAAARLDEAAASREHDAIADRIATAVRRDMWDEAAGMFSDVDPRTGARTGVKAAVCFYPYMTDIAGAEHVAGLVRNLFDPASFWTPYPVPSTAADDPAFDADGRWKEVRRNCPWNGRVWPMTNCHVADALAHVAVTHASSLRARAADLILRTVRMMCFEGDATRPNSYEHYSPMTGRASTYRGLDDYMHSWVNDLIVRWIAGFRPAPSGFIVDPLPSDIARLRLVRLPFRNGIVDLEFDEARVRVAHDGRVHEAARGEPIVVTR